MMDAMLPMFYSFGAVALSYLVGSLSFAVIVSKTMGLGDPRSYGSKNPGATNVLRSGSRLAAILTLLLDTAKGWLPVFLVQAWGSAYGLADASVAMVSLAAFLGHLFPVFFHFKGGKGVATAAGVLLGIHPLLGLAVGLVWLLVAALSRYSSLAALLAAAFAPVIYLLASGEVWAMSKAVLAAIAVMSALLFYRHSANMARLVQGRESRIGGQAKEAKVGKAGKAGKGR